MGGGVAVWLTAALAAGWVTGTGLAAADPDAPPPPANDGTDVAAQTPAPSGQPPAAGSEQASPSDSPGQGTPSGSPEHGAPSGPPPAPGPGGPGPQGVMARDGLYTVGVDILPGVYSSAGPLPDDACYWRRIAPDGSTVDNALSKQPQTVRIDAGDMAFKTNGCQPWQLTDAAPPNQNPPWLSQLQLRHSLDILNGLAGQSGNGQLPPY